MPVLAIRYVALHKQQLNSQTNGVASYEALGHCALLNFQQLLVFQLTSEPPVVYNRQHSIFSIALKTCEIGSDRCSITLRRH